jgi:hypothetical protein
VPAVAVADGSVVNPTLNGVVVATFTVELVAVFESVLSVAVSTQFSATVTAMLTLNVEVPLVSPVELPPLTVQPDDDDVITIGLLSLVSALPNASSIETATAKACPLVVVAGG